MTEPERELARECRVFTAYLLGCTPSRYVCNKYTDAHDRLDILTVATKLDALVLRFAKTGRPAAKVADAYASVFLSQSLLRRKLVVLLAILETAPSTYRLVDEIDSGSRVALLALTTLRTTSAVLALAAGALIFLPAQLIMRPGGKER